MKLPKLLIAALATATLATSVSAQPEFEGDVALACEAILCLSAGAGGRPSECVASIRKYFNIFDRKPHKTLEKRLNFLRLCPSVGESVIQQAKSGADAMEIQRDRECEEKCSDEVGQSFEGAGLSCYAACRSAW